MTKTEKCHGIIEEQRGNLASLVLGHGEKMKARDFQRSTVYAWENSFMLKSGDGDLTLDECQALIDLILWP